MKPGSGGGGSSGTGPSPTAATQDPLNSPSSELCHLPGKPIRDSAAWVFPGGRSHRLALPGAFPTPRLPRRKAGGRHKSCCLFRPSRRSEPCLSVRELVGGPPGIPVPRPQPEASPASRPLGGGQPRACRVITSPHTGGLPPIPPASGVQGLPCFSGAQPLPCPSGPLGPARPAYHRR